MSNDSIQIYFSTLKLMNTRNRQIRQRMEEFAALAARLQTLAVDLAELMADSHERDERWQEAQSVIAEVLQEYLVNQK